MAHTLIEGKTYNERLFSPGLRGFFHTARFRWLHASIKKMNVTGGSVIELGCNDGRSLKYLPFEPSIYKGYDADWEGGFEDAAKDWKDKPQYHFVLSEHPTSFNAEQLKFNLSISMETLEHLPANVLPAYISKLHAATKEYGFFSFPNERGMVFLMKYYFKKIFISQREPYTKGEIWNAFIGRMDKVERNETGHKGFDYKNLIRKLEQHFEIVELKGIPFSYLPASLSFTLGVIVKPKKLAEQGA